jgi:hypothetical protein
VVDLTPDTRIHGGNVVNEMTGLVTDMSEEMQYAFPPSAEKALVQASGIRAPIQCWGVQSFHSFRNCPRKEEPVIRENFNTNLKVWCEARSRNSRNEKAQRAANANAWVPSPVCLLNYPISTNPRFSSSNGFCLNSVLIRIHRLSVESRRLCWITVKGITSSRHSDST